MALIPSVAQAIDVTDLDWTLPAVDLLDIVTERLADAWEDARDGAVITDEAFRALADQADEYVMARLK